MPATLEALRAAFPRHLNLALSRAFGPGDGRQMIAIERLAQAQSIPVIAIGDVLYHAAERRPLQDVLTCIREHETLATIGRRLEPNAERHLRAPRDLKHIFKGHEQALANAAALFARIGFSLDELRHQYPEDPVFAELGGRPIPSQQALE
ncbi:MAG: hypothetical protein KDK70_44465, partial [Myxococcales bacterium]|nr:hypothetical protein [Myxococcales bacterium]